MKRPVPNPRVMDVPGYFQGASHFDGMVEPIKLSSNENAHGPSPAAIDAIRDAAASAHIYPEGQATVLNDALSRRHGIASDQIVTSTGSDDLIPMLIRGFAPPGSEVLYFEDSFAKYPIYVLGAGCEPVVLPRDKNADYRVRLEDVKAALNPRTKFLLLDNPANPTGAVLGADEVRALHAILPTDVILILDEAYAEFSDLGDAGLQLAREAPNVVTMRTFSKAYALAGLRIGWCVGAPEIVEAMRRLRASFPITVPSIAAAVAALGDTEHFEKTIAAIRHTRDTVVEVLRGQGWRIPDSHGNFFLIRFEGQPPMNFEAAQTALVAENVLVRPLTIQGGEQVLRVTVGTDAQMKHVIRALSGESSS
ncbi:MAG: histidinol-phosphate transaminase [Alphaproteobacteria bacterium]|jgi:histidinol-phosphate aminotransferase|nr:histidinol-phosphate transaminase [Alphaproteobacteria bacterium]